VLSRQAIVALLTFGSGIVLARTLSPADFGLFAIATFVVVLTGMLTDLGLHSALVQRSETLATVDLRTAFTIQCLVNTLALALLWPAAAWLPAVYPKASAELVGLVRLMSLDLYLLSWCRPSEALLERSLRYERLVPIDVAGTSVYAAVAIALALGGSGVWSFGIAWVASTVTRLALVYRAAPWPVGFAWDRDAVRRLLGPGVPLQISRVVAQAQYWVAPTLVAGTIGPAAAGFLQWAAGNGRKPLEILEHLARVSLPHFSRLQHDEREVESTLSRYVTLFVLASGLWLSVLAAAGRDLVVLVYTERWLPAVPAMVLFAGVGVLVSVRAVVTTALAGLGRTMLVARVSVATAVATIAASVALVLSLGPIGVPLGQLVGATVVVPLLARGLGPHGMARVLRAARTALPPASVAVLVGLLTSLTPLDAAPRGLVTAGVVTVTYCLVAWWMAPAWMRGAVRGLLARARVRPEPRTQA
jgi:PST family polysaccharide transporter